MRVTRHMNSQTAIDSELNGVAAEIRKLDPQGLRAAQVLRETLDQLYDGQRTGRYRWDQLYNTERTKGGALVEMNLHREFKFEDGEKLNFRIAGVDVDCKYSQKLGAWMIPPEARGHLCLVVWAEDSKTPAWSMGIVRVAVEHLNTGGNRDAKATLNEAGRNAITWLFKNAPLPPNVLLQLDAGAVERIMTQASGQKRINELFRSALGRVVGRAVVATVAQQDDYMKRVRANGGARTALQREGIVILGQYDSHAATARALGVPVPGRGESVSVRLSPAHTSGTGVAEINGRLWRVAGANDPVVAAPDLPEI
jgi:restriction endonuclease NaeI